MTRWYIVAFDGGARLLDGPWGVDDEGRARERAAAYDARLRAEQAGEAKVLAAEDLDELLTTQGDLFQGDAGVLLLRGKRALTTVDLRARMFTPSGLAPGAPMHDEDVLVLVQQRLRARALASNAPQVLHDHVRALRALTVYASFDYDFNAFVSALAGLAYELSLGVKFVQQHPQGVSIIRARTGERATLSVDHFGTLADALDREGTHPIERGWTLEGHPRFRPTLGGLLHWANAEGLLANFFAKRWTRAGPAVRAVELTRQGDARWVPAVYDTWTPAQQRTWWETDGRAHWERDTLRKIARGRNTLAHPTMHAIDSPVDALRAIDALCEFIAALWPGP